MSATMTHYGGTQHNGPSDLFVVRTQRLRQLVLQHNGLKPLATALGLNGLSYIGQLLQDPPVRRLSEKVARSWEQKLSLPQRWFDQASDEVPQGFSVERLTEVILAINGEMVSAELLLPAAAYAELIVLLYSAAPIDRPFDREHAKRVVHLLMSTQANAKRVIKKARA